MFADARLTNVESWFSESAEERILPKLRRRSIESLFCCSDCLAVATIGCYNRSKRPVPPLISFLITRPTAPTRPKNLA